MAAPRTRAPNRSRRRATPAYDEPERPSIWREALWGLDWLSLRLSPVYLGLGVPRGDGSPVVLVPGFMMAGFSMMEMFFWLRRIGYRPFLSGIGVNADCIHASARRLEKTVEDISTKAGTPVRVIGHSLGGILARKVALQRPDIVTQLISLGSPLHSLAAHPAVMAATALFQDRVRHPPPAEGAGLGLGIHLLDDCECGVDHCVPSPPPSVRRAALYSRDDGVVHWRNSLEPDQSLNHEVGGAHFGLLFNPKVYRVIANLLAEGTPERKRRSA